MTDTATKTAFSAREKIEMEDFLKEKGFMFENRRLRKPGTKEILKITVGTKRLDKEKFGQTVIGINLDAERDPWFVASSWEQSQLHQVPISEIPDDKMKLAAAAYISTAMKEFKNLAQTEKPEEPHPLPNPPTCDPEKVEPPKQELSEEVKLPVEQVGQPAKPPIEAAAQPAIEPEPSQLQIIKNVTQDRVEIIRNSKGYNWEISVHDDDVFRAIDRAIIADLRLRTQFGGDA
ncbi:TPA: hypothetical protein HA338_06230 [Methanosarcina acetivorans]|uniref:Uncharacterized protein n=2 Tax=Methanosarcina acetivorans TaxID=2214 RepID=Q8TJF1_METAC|nr:hypothetical protein [Methanosarcina acetivorans]AAM07185.1 predicted protein [Methanosarcina acetivorans C2A]HIH93638.1 hypothetical protein [Methanosarcina acetivorans]